jgi:hypothetical protein
MKFANTIKLDRKSGVRSGEGGAPVDSLSGGYDTGPSTALHFCLDVEVLEGEFGREERRTADPSTSVGMMTKGRVALPFRFDHTDEEQQVPPLRSGG